MKIDGAASAAIFATKQRSILKRSGCAIARIVKNFRVVRSGLACRHRIAISDCCQVT